MLIGYMRVSKSDGSQTIDLQRDALIAAGVDPAQIYEDRASGRLDARPGLGATLKALRAGDTLVVWRLDRLGRNLPRNQKPTKVIAGRTIKAATTETGGVVVLFDDQSNMKIKTAGPAPIPPGGKVKSVHEAKTESKLILK